MGLKGYRLWVMGQHDSTCRAPPRVRSAGRGGGRAGDALRLRVVRERRVVALQVAFERKTLKPVFHLIRYRLWV
jgi:hypothetical protein